MVDVPGGEVSSGDRPEPTQPLSSATARMATGSGTERIASWCPPRGGRHRRSAEVSLGALAARLQRLVLLVPEDHESEGEVLLDDEVEDAVVEAVRQLLLH